MDTDFWRARWQEGQTAFNEGKPNSFLAGHHAVLAPCKRILVPLCGKAEDLAYLAGQGHDVVGIELVEDAVRQFFAEHSTTPTITTDGALTRYAAGSITVLAGDFFAATATHVGAIDGIYDRAALVALPPEMRGPYVTHLRTIAPGATRELLVSFDDPEARPDGPPFSVPETEIHALFASATVELLESAAALTPLRRGDMRERCYSIKLA